MLERGRRRDFYEVLQVSKGASDAQIKRAYRKLALQVTAGSGNSAACFESGGQVSKHAMHVRLACDEPGTNLIGLAVPCMLDAGACLAAL